MELMSVSLPPPPGPLQDERIATIRSEAAGLKQTVEQSREPDGAVIVTITGNITAEQGVVYSVQGYLGSLANSPDMADGTAGSANTAAAAANTSPGTTADTASAAA